MCLVVLALAAYCLGGLLLGASLLMVLLAWIMVDGMVAVMET